MEVRVFFWAPGFIPFSAANEREYRERFLYLADGTQGVIREIQRHGTWVHVILREPVDISIIETDSHISFDPLVSSAA